MISHDFGFCFVLFEFLGGLDVFHELDNIVSLVFHGMESLMFHLFLPRLWRTEENDVNHLTKRQALVVTKGRQVGWTLHVVPKKVLKAEEDLCSLGLASVATHLVLDPGQDMSMHDLGQNVPKGFRNPCKVGVIRMVNAFHTDRILVTDVSGDSQDVGIHELLLLIG